MLWAMNIVLENTPTTLTLHYKSEASAKDAQSQLRQARATAGCTTAVLNDDYTRTADIPLKCIVAAIISDVNGGMESSIEQQLILARSNATLMSKANSDPKLKLLAAQGQIPGVRTQ